MANPFKILWRVITFPFWLVFTIIAFPFRAIWRFVRFLNTEPEEHPLGDVVAGIVSDKSVRAFLWSEIESLRKHLLRAVLVVLAVVGVTFTYTVPVMEFLSVPIGGLEKLQAIQVTEEVGVFMKIAFSLGITIAFPYIVFETWWFAAPGLRPREKKYGLLSIPFATLLFVGGMAFAYFAMLPTALPILGGFTKIAQNWTAMEYFDFVNGLIFWMGIAFEFPLIVYVLTAMGFLKPQGLAQQWRIAMVIIAVAAAAVTPTVDPLSMGVVMAPLTLLYFISIGLSFLAYAGRRKTEEET
ncbi:MAG: twin-arginine translocase subunit TatC [Chloroflexota bacterium]|jgi:sec-independent protein translocase protein TatC